MHRVTLKVYCKSDILTLKEKVMAKTFSVSGEVLGVP